ncbi:glycosyltransferase [Paenibacillus lautus]|uniref:glycosyltransferase n=1 Tax=Paenibacillus lautus TaxID=1401 RepID=UPI00209CAB69|nr:glycosyltransferase family A protein [Paenibacillus lautus]
MGKKTAADGVSIIVCTNRPQFFEQAIDNFRRQNYRNKELIIILNKDCMDLKKYRDKAQAYENVKVYKVPERISLGKCLNCGFKKAKYPFLAKFDDDDYYSPYYLKEQIKQLNRTKSDIVGKHSCLVYLTASKQLIIRSPHEKNKYVEFVQGGTILFKRHVLDKVRFSDRSVGEDVAFLRQSRMKGFRAYATSPYNYVYVRRKNKQTHTWRANDAFYLRGSKPVGFTENYRRIADRDL